MKEKALFYSHPIPGLQCVQRYIYIYLIIYIYIYIKTIVYIDQSYLDMKPLGVFFQIFSDSQSPRRSLTQTYFNAVH